MTSRLKAGLLFASFSALALYTGLQGYSVAFVGTLLVLLTVLLAYLWNRYVFSRLSLTRSLNRRQVEFDGAASMQITLTNRKILPLFGLTLSTVLSPGIDVRDGRNKELVQKGQIDVFSDYFHLNWYEKRTRTYELLPAHRGRFEFACGSLTYADPFGLFLNTKDAVFPPTHLIVYPRIVPIQGIAALNTYLFGSRPKDGWIFVDPLNRVGTRPYTSTDSARQINWKATARHLQTQVDVEKPSFDQEVYLILSQPPDAAWWTRSVSNNLEIAIMTAASLIHRYSEQGYQIRLLTNLVSKRHGLEQARHFGAKGKAQRSQLLTSLALLQNFSVKPITQAAGRLKKELKPGSTVIFLTTAPAALEDDFVRLVRGLSVKGKVAVIRVQPNVAALAPTPRLKEWKVEGGSAWHEIPQLELF